MLSKVADFITKERLLSNDGLHLVALSGGADSVALLLVLQRLGYHIEAVHCNFHLRGDESDRDESFVKLLCEKEQIRIHLTHFDTEEYASLHKVSIEMAARELRYNYFNQLCQDIGAETICVAHHRDDAIETMLMNLIRGAGIHGLTGIRPRNGRVVRPLLCLSRQEIEDFLDSIGQTYVVDSTNLQDNVVRNNIRLNLLPMMRNINPSVSDNIMKTTTYISEVEKIVNHAIQQQMDEMIIITDSGNTQKANIKKLISVPSPEILLHEWLTPMGFNSTQVEQIASACYNHNKHCGKVFSSSSHELVIDRQFLIVETLQDSIRLLKIPETGCYIYNEKLKFDIRILDNIYISNNPNSATIDARRVSFPLIIRPIAQGDSFCPYGMNGNHKLVSDLLTNLKLSLFEKKRQLVITDANDNILWLVGRRIDHRYRVTDKTSEVLILTLKAIM